MQQYTPYFAGYEAAAAAAAAAAQNPQQQPQDQQQAQPALALGGQNLAIYAPMQPLPVLSGKPGDPQHAQVMTGTSTMDLGAHGKPKRKQVKNACVNCQKACKKCDIGRPCQRCIKYGLTDTCVNSVRKERKKGIKRGPYKKRNKNELGGESATSSGASTPNMASPVTNTNIYAQNNNVRPNTMPMHYQPFGQGHYDTYGYVNNNQIMPQAYMMPTGLSQMYPTNPPVLSYQAAMSIISPQQSQPHQPQQPGVANANYRPQEQGSNNMSSNAATPTNATPTNTTPTANTNTASPNQGAVGTPDIKTEGDEDDEGSKLNILSQLCSAVLDSNPPKQESHEQVIKAEDVHQNTPPPTRPHSRETSHDNKNANNVMPLSHLTGANLDTDSTRIYAQLNHSAADISQKDDNNTPVYGTPGSSPADSPAPSMQVKPQVWNTTTTTEQTQ
ncbi:hypothetical protein EDC96DRAFT_470019 [Choanephora cucurbitarum]|nr:hypothetical protein EDC96DRAFT_470019 [Choanephora cucurbitarum]